MARNEFYTLIRYTYPRFNFAGTAGASYITSVSAGAHARAFGTPTVAPGPRTVSVSPTLHTRAFGTPTIVPGARMVTTTSVVHSRAFGSPVVNRGQVTVAPESVVHARAFGDPTVVEEAFDPTHISGCTHWFDASDDDDFTYATGVAVSEWRDKSGGNRHITQVTGGKRPFRDSFLNGLATVRFTGSEFLDRVEVCPFTTQACTVFAVALEGTHAADYVGIVGVRPPGGAANDFDQPGAFCLNWGTGAQTLRVERWGSAPGVNGSRPVPASVMTARFNTNGLIETWRNSVAGSTGNPGASFGTPVGIEVGGRYTTSTPDSYKMVGQVAEIVVYSRVLTDIERQQVEDYLTEKWLRAPMDPPTVSRIDLRPRVKAYAFR